MNRLANETSPYLLQHADNPVDWYPWGDEAFEEAAASNKAVLLSVGYSSCHWCHVMAHESFEDPATARLMNDWFVNVKVDREERPDVDGIYMTAVQAMTGRGGWPMTVWLTPDGKPFFAGTYFPKDDHHGLPSFTRVLAAVNEAWQQRRSDAVRQAEELTVAIGRRIPPAESAPAMEDVIAAYTSLASTFDDDHAGFGGAPKFPQEPVLEFLLRVSGHSWAPRAREMLLASLRAMAVGGLYDHVGGGFARYTVDREWTIPHFEKMLYDNALLAHLYLWASRLPGPESGRFEQIARSTLDYVLRDMTHPEGGWYSAEDADSEGVEGRFYVFTKSEFDEIVGDDAALARAYFGVSEEGNFEGSNHLQEAVPISLLALQHDLSAENAAAAIARARRRLFDARQARVRPGLDDKVITAWNGLMLRAMSEGGIALGDERYLSAAVANARFVTTELIEDGRALRSWRDQGRGAGFLDDHAAYAVGLYTLYQASGDVEWFEHAERLVESIIEHFWDPDAGLFQTPSDGDELIVRPKDQMDNPSPSGASLAVEALQWSAMYTGNTDRHALADQIRLESARIAEGYPSAAGYLLAVSASQLAGLREVAIIGPGSEALFEVFWSEYRPQAVLAYAPDGRPDPRVPLLRDREPGLAYVCEHFACRLPVDDPAELSRQLDETGGA